jgi:uncharacterized RDD family membrane protein YckC
MYRKPIGVRIIAYVIDFIVIFIIGILLHSLIGFGTVTKTGMTYYFNMTWTETTIVSVLYFGLIEFLLYGKTIGKAIVRLEVKDDSLQQLTNRFTYLLRGGLKGLLTVIGIISFLAVALREDKRSFHDMVFKTVVVKQIRSHEIITKKELN